MRPFVKVPFFDMAAELAAIRSDIDRAIARVLDSASFIGGPEVAAFERELAAFTGAGHAVGTSSGTDALHLLGMALGIGTGDEVVVTPFTFAATASAFARLGAHVVFADIDDETLCLSPSAAAAAITPKTRAVVTVNLFGLPAPIPTVPCPVIEDAAQSIGAAPPRALAATLSFFPTKNLGALGDAGAILTDDAHLAETLALLRVQGARPKYHHVRVGGNFRLDAIQAAILRVKLEHLSAWTAARRSNAARYRQLFDAAALEDVRLPPHHADHVFHQFVIRVAKRDELRTFLGENGIETEVYYPSPLHLQPAFSSMNARKQSFPVAERACHTVLALPIQPALTETSQAFIVDRVAAFYRTR